MKNFLIYLALAYIAMTIQAVIFKGIKPDFVLLIVCFYSLRYGHVKGSIYGALTGFLIDTASGFILGPNIISKAFAGFFVRSVRETVYQWNILVNTLTIIFLSVANVFLVYICLETFSKISFVNRSWNISVIEIMYTILASLPLYVLFKPDKYYIMAEEEQGFK